MSHSSFAPPPSDWLHPVRYFRSRDFAKQLVGDLALKVGPSGYPTVEHSNMAMAKIQASYNRLVPEMPREFLAQNPITNLHNELAFALLLANFTAAGRQVFALPPGLVHSLEATDLGDVRLEDLLLPFDTFYLSFGSAYAAALPGGPNQIEGAYVRRLILPGNPDKLHFALVGRHPVPAGRHGISPLNWMAFRDVVAYSEFSPSADPLLGQTLDQHVDGYFSAKRAELTVDRPDAPTTHPDFPGKMVFTDTAETRARALKALDAGEPVIRRTVLLVMNALVYLSTFAQRANAEDTEIGEPAWPSDTPPELLKGAATTGTGHHGRKRREAVHARLLAGGYVPLRMLPPLDAPEHDDALTGDREVSPHMRRAHWRRQRVGPGRRGVKLLRIAAVLVRADLGVPAQGRIRLLPDAPPDSSAEQRP